MKGKRSDLDKGRGIRDVIGQLDWVIKGAEGDIGPNATNPLIGTGGRQGVRFSHLRIVYSFF